MGIPFSDKDLRILVTSAQGGGLAERRSARPPQTQRKQNMNTLIQTERSTRGGLLLAIPLALLSSIGSIAVAVMVGWQRGAVTPDRLLMASVNIIAVLAAQLLPALAARQAGARKAPFLAVWAICLAWAVVQHASYLLAAQERAGQARVEAVALSQAQLETPKRDVPAILHDKAELTDQLARLSGLGCGTVACAKRQQLRAQAINERRAALDAEIQLVASFDQLHRSQQEQRQRAMDDIVGSRLAGVLGVAYASVTSAMALGIAVILEGVGCLCWAFICRVSPVASTPPAPRSVTVTEVATPEPTVPIAEAVASERPVTDVTQCGPSDVDGKSHDSSATTRRAGRDSSRPASPRARDFHKDVAQVTAAVRDSAIALRVIPVRDFLGCSQRHARRVRDFVAEAEA